MSVNNPRRLVLFGIVMTAVAVMICWTLYLARGALLLVYVSALFAIGMSPLVRMIERQRLFPIGPRKFPRWLAILVIYFAVIGSLMMVMSLVAAPLTGQAQELWRQLPEMLDRAQQELVRIGILRQPVTWSEAIAKAPGSGQDAVQVVVEAISGLIGGVFGLVTILILTFYLLVEAESIFDTFIRLFPSGTRERVDQASRQVSLKVSAWLGGQLLLGAIIGSSAALGLFLMGVPYFYVLAVLAGIGEMIPIVGPVLAAIPAIAVALSVSPKLALLVAIFFFVQQQLENHVLVPKVMSRQVGVSAVTVIVALLIGGSLLGLVGALLAVPSAAILQVILQELLAMRKEP